MSFLDSAESYIFGGDTGLTYEGLKRRQDIAKALASQRQPYPKNIGEGITALGQGIGGRLAEGRLMRAEKNFQDKEDAQLAGAAAAQRGGVTPQVTPQAAPAVQPQVSSFDESGFGGAPPPLQVANAPRVSATIPEDRMAIINKHEPDPTMREYYAQMVRKEQPNRGAMSPTGARGMFQFGERTGRGYGLVGDGFDNRDSDDASMQAVRKFTQDNIQAFQRINNRMPTLQELAVMHQQGPVTGARMVAGTGNAPARNLQVNNIDPNASPQDAVAHINKYYGLPNTPVPDAYSARGRVSSALQQQQPGAPQGVAQVNPTMSGPAPVPTSQEVGGPVDSGDDGEHGAYDPTTPTDIQPAPATATVAQGPAGGPPQVRQPGVFNPPVELTLPAEQTMPDPGPRPKEPGIEPQLPGQKEWLGIINSRFASPYAKEVAQRNYDQLEKVRVYNQTVKQQEYVNAREKWEQKVDAKEKFDREREDRRAKQKADYLAATNSQADLEKKFYEATTQREQEQIKRALDIKKAQGEVEKQEYERTTQRGQEETQRGLNIQKTTREVNDPRTLNTQETQYQAPYNPATGTYGPYTLAPGAPQPKEDPLTADQSDAVRFVIRVKPDVQALERGGNGKVLTDPVQRAAWALPGGNYLVSDEYREAANAQQSFDSGYMKVMSGAAISASEAALHLPAFQPKPGDSDEELARKARRRADFIDAAEKTTGRRGLEIIAKSVQNIGREHAWEQEAKLPPVKVGSPAEARAKEGTGELKPGRRLELPDGKIINVPRRGGAP